MMTDLPELRAALADESKLDVLTAQAEAWQRATTEQRAEILADIRRRGLMERFRDGLDAALTFHEKSVALFRDVLAQTGSEG